MGRFLRRRRVVEEPSSDGFWHVPPHFNFTRDVIEAFAGDPLRPALTFVDRDGVIDRRTFAEVASQANRWAGLLRARGLAPGDRLLVLVGKTPAWHAVLLGALKAGLVTVPCSELLRSRDLDFRAEHSGARLVVADSERAAEVARMEVPLEVVIVEDATAELRSHSVLYPTHDTTAMDLAFILYTSGTTKNPKGVAHTHGYAWAKRLQAEYWLDARPGDLVWCTAGTGWAKSIWNVLLGPWSRGAELVVHDGGFDVEQRFDLLERLGVTVLCQAPTEYRLMAKAPSLERFDLSRIRHAVSAGEPLNPEVIATFRETFGLTLYDGYGQTENTLLVANTRDAEIKPGSMGLPTPGHDVAVIDDEGNEVAPGVEGDIALRGRPPSLFLGYWNAPDETSAVFRGEWYVTGDRATCDDDGYLWFTGRADDVILSAAYRIGPFEVENALLEHPAVAESAVVGKPDPDRGELVKAFVVLRPEYEPSDELARELQDHVKAVTAPYKYPREIEFLVELPKTASGKIRRVELRERERTGRTWQGAARPVVEPVELFVEPAAEPWSEPDVETVPDPVEAAVVSEVVEHEQEPGVAEASADDEAARRAAAEQAILDDARRQKELRAAAAAELAAAEAAARAERRADLERRTREAAEQARAAEEAREAEHAAQARQEEEAREARREEEARAAERAAQARHEEEARAAEQAEARRREQEAREAERAAQARREEEARAAEQAEARRREQEAREAERAAQARREEEARAAERAEERRREHEAREAERAARALAAEEAMRSQQARQAADEARAQAGAAKVEERARPSKEDEKRRRAEEKAAAEQARQEEARARRAAEAKAKSEERQRKEDEKRRRAEEKAAAEQAKRDEAEARRAAELKAKEDERQRKEDEKRHREEQKAAAEQARVDAEKARLAERKAEEDRRAAEALQREADERLRKEAEQQRKADEARKRAERRKPTPSVPLEEDEFDVGEDRLNPALISRLRAYGRREDAADMEGAEPAGGTEGDEPPAE